MTQVQDLARSTRQASAMHTQPDLLTMVTPSSSPRPICDLQSGSQVTLYDGAISSSSHVNIGCQIFHNHSPERIESESVVEALLAAVKDGDVAEIGLILKGQADRAGLVSFELDQPHNTSPLRLACTRRAPAVVTALLASLSKSTKREILGSLGEDGLSPFHLSVSHGNLEVIKSILTSRMADPGRATSSGDSALHLACRSGHQEAVLEILNFGDVEVQRKIVNSLNNKFEQPLHLASCQGNVETIKLLLQKGAFINAVAKDGKTPLLYAAFYKQYNIMSELLKKGANVSTQDHEKNTVLHFIDASCPKELMKELLRLGARLYVMNLYKKNPLENLSSTVLSEALYDLPTERLFEHCEVETLIALRNSNICNTLLYHKSVQSIIEKELKSYHLFSQIRRFMIIYSFLLTPVWLQFSKYTSDNTLMIILLRYALMLIICVVACFVVWLFKYSLSKKLHTNRQGIFFSDWNSNLFICEKYFICSFEIIFLFFYFKLVEFDSIYSSFIILIGYIFSVFIGMMCHHWAQLSDRIIRFYVIGSFIKFLIIFHVLHEIYTIFYYTLKILESRIQSSQQFSCKTVDFFVTYYTSDNMYSDMTNRNIIINIASKYFYTSYSILILLISVIFLYSAKFISNLICFYIQERFKKLIIPSTLDSANWWLSKRSRVEVNYKIAPNSVCGVCLQNIGNASLGVMCDMSCKRVFHHQCAGLEPKAVRALKDNKELMWACRVCKFSSMTSFSGGSGQIEDQLNAMEMRITNYFTQSISGQTSAICDIQQKIGTIEQRLSNI